jgi:hypothetical protein
LFDVASVNDASNAGRTGHMSTIASRKRKRPATDDPFRNQPEPNYSAATSKRNRRRPATDSFVQRSPPLDAGSSDCIEIENIVDGALRLSICGGLGKSANGLKLKANTFRLGLAGVSPVLWRNGYLPVGRETPTRLLYVVLNLFQALSQRAHLLPTIARSFSQMTCVRALSTTLKNKITALGVVSNRDLGVAYPSSPIASRLWIHLQKGLSNKSSSPLQACVASNAHPAHADSDDMLAEVEEQSRHPHPYSDRAIPHKVAEHVDSQDVFDDGHTRLLGRPALLEDVYGMQQTAQDMNPGFQVTAIRELEHDLRLQIKPQDPMSTVDHLGDEQSDTIFSSAPYITSSTHALSPIIQETQFDLGTSWRPEISSDSDGMPMLAESRVSREENSPFEDRGERDIDSTEELLLGFDRMIRGRKLA